jgi:hypothetical protein
MKSAVIALVVGSALGAATIPSMSVGPREDPADWLEHRFRFSSRLRGPPIWWVWNEPPSEHRVLGFE